MNNEYLAMYNEQLKNVERNNLKTTQKIIHIIKQLFIFHSLKFLKKQFQTDIENVYNVS